MTISHEDKPMKKLLICLLIFVGAIFISCNFVINATTTKTVPEQPMIQTEPLSLIVETPASSTDILLEEEPEPEPLATREEIELLALCTMAEKPVCRYVRRPYYPLLCYGRAGKAR